MLLQGLAQLFAYCIWAPRKTSQGDSEYLGCDDAYTRKYLKWFKFSTGISRGMSTKNSMEGVFRGSHLGNCEIDFKLMTVAHHHQAFLPSSVSKIENPQTDIPRIAKDKKLLAEIEAAVKRIPTKHYLVQGDARKLSFIEDESVHLVVTSPPYWTLKKYRDHEDQLGSVENYEKFLLELDKVWEHCYRVLVPGGRLICVVGDVCLSRRKNGGRHTVVPLHASIQEHCRKIGYDNLAPIIWYKITNAVFEASGNGAGFFGKPYEPNAIIKNDIEYILMERKPGGYRNPAVATRVLSVISEENHKQWFRPIWSGITGASTRNHPAPYPEELVERLIRMFSFVGDTILDPFMGTGTTTVAAAKWGRNSIGVEVDYYYYEMAVKRIRQATASLCTYAEIETDIKRKGNGL